MNAEVELPMGLEEARKHPFARRAAGEPVPIGTMIRWLYTGCRGIVLESEMRGGRRVIFPSAIARFNARLSEKPELKSRRTSKAETAAAERRARVVERLARKKPRHATAARF